MIKTIAVIGAGTMGNGIAHVFAQAGFSVQLNDRSIAQLERAMHTISANLDRQVAKSMITAGAKQQTIENIRVCTSLDEAVQNADLVVEAASEDAALKHQIFKELDGLAPAGCILSSNTSSISISSLASATRRPGSVIGMHFMNPVPVMKLVEVIRGKLTDETVTTAIVSLSEAIGKIPCVVNDFPGFVANRILMPMLNEAINSLHEGVAGVREIDTIMKLGMAHPMGPLQLADYIGLDVCLSILKVLEDGFANPHYKPSPLLREMVEAGTLGVKTGEGFYSYAAGSKTPEVSRRFRK